MMVGRPGPDRPENTHGRTSLPPTPTPNPPPHEPPHAPPDHPADGIPPTPRRTVWFSRGGLKGGAGLITGSAAVLPMLLLAIAGLCVIGFLMLARYPWLPLPARAALMSAVFLALGIGVGRMLARGYRRTMNALKITVEMDPDADVNVICWPDQIEPMKKLIPDDEGAFEPEVFRVWKTTRRSAMALFENKAARIRFVLLVSLWPLVLNGLIQSGAHGLIDWATVFAVAAVLLMIPVIWSYIHPAYLRVAPGRVDIVRYSFIGSKPRVESHSLRDRPVRLDLRRKELLIGGWHPSHPDAEPKDGEEEEPLPELDAFVLAQQAKDPQASLGSRSQWRTLTIIPLWATLEQGRLERAVFRAAVSTAEPGPLPDDALIG